MVVGANACVGVLMQSHVTHPVCTPPHSVPGVVQPSCIRKWFVRVCQDGSDV
jgi:hypothetical protein